MNAERFAGKFSEWLVGWTSQYEWKLNLPSWCPTGVAQLHLPNWIYQNGFPKPPVLQQPSTTYFGAESIQNWTPVFWHLCNPIFQRLHHPVTCSQNILGNHRSPGRAPPARHRRIERVKHVEVLRHFHEPIFSLDQKAVFLLDFRPRFALVYLYNHPYYILLYNVNKSWTTWNILRMWWTKRWPQH